MTYNGLIDNSLNSIHDKIESYNGDIQLTTKNVIILKF